MRNFTEQDLEGAGQYLVLNRKPPNKFEDIGYLSTLMVKVGWGLDNGQYYCLFDMSDGMAYSICPSKQALVEALNNENNEEYRFATQKEVSDVVNYQSHRWRNPE